MTAYKRVSHAIDSLRNEINAAHPGRSKISDGTLGDTAHAARKSDHNPDSNGIVHAIDVTVWDDNDADFQDDVALPLAEHLRARRDPRTKYVIHRGQMFASYATASRPAWQWGPYSGPNGHFHHVHVSVYGDDGAPWGYGKGQAASGVPAYTGTPLRYGGPSSFAVAQWKVMLRSLGYQLFSTSAKGINTFSRGLAAATKRFQKNNGLKVDGIVGPQTWAKAAAKIAAQQTRKD